MKLIASAAAHSFPRSARPLRTVARILQVAAVLPIAWAPLHAQVGSQFAIVTDTTNPEFDGFGGDPQLNDRGTVAFYAEKPPGNGSIYTAAAGANPVLISPGGDGAPSINEHGTVASTRDVGNGTQTQIYKHTPDGRFHEVARTGTKFRSFPNFAYLSDNGTVVFFANRYPASPTRYGLFAGTGDGKTTLLADNFGEFATFGSQPTINAAGTIAFTASKDNTESGLYIATGGTTAGIRTVITQDGTPLRKFDGAPFINDNGRIALQAYEDNTGQPAIAHVKEDGTGLTVFARAGGVGPYSSFHSPVINNVGTIVFYATLDTGGRGIFAGPKPVADKIVVVGDPLFGSTVTNLAYLRGLNNLNEIAFYFALEDGRSGIAKAKVTPRVTAPHPAPLPTSYHLTEIEPLAGQQLVHGAAINQKGQIAGSTETYGFRRTGDVSQQLNPLEGGDVTRAFAINNNGAVVGDSTFTNGGGIRHATLWSGGTITDLGTLPDWGNYSRASGINLGGQVVGTSGPKMDSLTTHAFIWDRKQGMRDLGVGIADATAINLSGVVAGSFDVPIESGGTSRHAFRWTGTDGAQDLGTLAGSTSFGTAINNSGSVAGYSTINGFDNREHAFLYDGVQMQDLGSLTTDQNSSDPFYSDRSFAYGINNSNHVVGSTYLPYNGGGLYGVAFIYGDGKMRNLETLVDGSGAGYRLFRATAINDAGQIVIESDGPNGVRAVLLTPNAPAAAVAEEQQATAPEQISRADSSQ